MGNKRQLVSPGKGKNQLTASQRRAAEIFATNDVHNMTVQEVADEVGVDKRTVYRWKKDPDFIKYQNDIAEQAMEDFLSEAYNKLKSLLREGQSEKVQLDAIKLVLQNRGKLTQDHEHTIEVKQTQSLDELEAEVLEMEKDLLSD